MVQRFTFFEYTQDDARNEQGRSVWVKRLYVRKCGVEEGMEKRLLGSGVRLAGAQGTPGVRR
jgi:hypothetical protein